MTKQELSKLPEFREMVKGVLANHPIYGNESCCDKIVDDYIKSLEPEWEILSYDEDGTIWSKGEYGYYFTGNGSWGKEGTFKNSPIHSVRYKGEVFTVGDMVRFDDVTFKINSIDKIGDYIYLNNLLSYISRCHKVSPVFTTNGDNEPISVGDKYYELYENKIIEHTCGDLYLFFDTESGMSIAIAEAMEKNKTKIFKSKEKAEDWLIRNATVLSVKKLMENMEVFNNVSFLTLKELARKELGI